MQKSPLYCFTLQRSPIIFNVYLKSYKIFYCLSIPQESSSVYDSFKCVLADRYGVFVKIAARHTWHIADVYFIYFLLYFQNLVNSKLKWQPMAMHILKNSPANRRVSTMKIFFTKWFTWSNIITFAEVSDSAIWTSNQVTTAIKKIWPEEKVQNLFFCRLSGCSSLSKEEGGRLQVAEDAKKTEKKKPDKFKHEWMLNPRYWSVCYVEGHGFYCVLCKKHNVKNAQNKSQTFSESPSRHLKEDSLRTHMASSVHSSTVEADPLQWMSVSITTIDALHNSAFLFPVARKQGYGCISFKWWQKKPRKTVCSCLLWLFKQSVWYKWW